MNRHNNMIIRPFEKADLFALRNLICETIEISYRKDYPSRAIDFFKQFHSKERIMERTASGTVLVVEQDGELVATGSLDGAEIFAVFVDPGRQGTGLGRKLMELLENRAHQNGVTKTVLSISLPSRRFYEGLGYQVVEERSRDLGSGQVLKFWKAEKQIYPSMAISSGLPTKPPAP
ncbi:MAG: GNAT family N-acetyltransferase [Mesorhizobium sp.]|nr:MAG: GNAT family N-acetyltransferase [Mesorhizobium sp.]